MAKPPSLPATVEAKAAIASKAKPVSQADIPAPKAKEDPGPTAEAMAVRKAKHAAAPGNQKPVARCEEDRPGKVQK
jgi:hypothetical protein